MSEIDYIANLKKYHAEKLFSLIGSPVGSSAEEIQTLESKLGFSFPLAYKQYLMWMGNDKSGVFVGCDWFLDDVWENTRDFKHLLKENNVDWNLPDAYCVFMGHQGYMGAYFEFPVLNDDPPVYFYSESSETNSVERIDGFVKFLTDDFLGMAECTISVRSAQRNRGER